jgi:hypothetical protein
VIFCLVTSNQWPLRGNRDLRKYRLLKRPIGVPIAKASDGESLWGTTLCSVAVYWFEGLRRVVFQGKMGGLWFLKDSVPQLCVPLSKEAFSVIQCYKYHVRL